ncbi:hypothetical protein GW17_00037673 [Ensete ventricosum]|nr:hypothetical protein GW17_00037673 [Ensete ventricosum]
MGSDRKVYTLAEVSAHNSVNDCWLVIDGKVRIHFIPPQRGWSIEKMRERGEWEGTAKGAAYHYCVASVTKHPSGTCLSGY